MTLLCFVGIISFCNGNIDSGMSWGSVVTFVSVFPLRCNCWICSAMFSHVLYSVLYDFFTGSQLSMEKGKKDPTKAALKVVCVIYPSFSFKTLTLLSNLHTHARKHAEHRVKISKSIMTGQWDLCGEEKSRLNSISIEPRVHPAWLTPVCFESLQNPDKHADTQLPTYF